MSKDSLLSLPAEIIHHILIYLPYRDLQTFKNLQNKYLISIINTYFWQTKIKHDFNVKIDCYSENIEEKYLELWTCNGGCERGSEKYLNHKDCLFRAIQQDDSELIKYFSRPSLKISKEYRLEIAFIVAVLSQDEDMIKFIFHHMRLPYTSLDGHLYCMGLKFTSQEWDILGYVVGKHGYFSIVKFLIEHTPTSVKYVLEGARDGNHDKLIPYLEDIYQKRSGFYEWIWLQSFKLPPQPIDQ